MNRIAIGMTALSGVCLLASCKEQSPSMKAVRNAGTTMGAVAGGAQAAVATDAQDAAFGKVVSEINQAKGDAKDPIAAAGAILLAAAQVGQAGVSAEKFASLSSQRGVLLTEVEVLAAKWQSMVAMAGASKFDPAARIAEIDTLLATANTSIAASNADLAKAQADQQKLLTDMAGKLRQASDLERQAVELKNKASKLKASEAMSILEEGLALRARCDDLRLSAGKLEADSLLFEPRKLGINQKIEETQMQLKTLADEKAALAKRATAAGDAESQTRAKADESATQLADVASRLKDLREKEIVPAFEAAIASAEQGSSSASRAGSDGSAKVWAARASHRAADLWLARSQEAAQFAVVAERLAKMEPALPGQSQFASQGKAAADAAKDAAEKAKEAYTQARERYGSLSLRSDSAEAIKANLIKQLGEIAGIKDDAPPADAPPAEPTPDAGAGDKSPVEPVPGDAPDPNPADKGEGEPKPTDPPVDPK
jgi:hypothetical protein